ncbi:hypothetical protein [Streptomyces wedmorensis]
MCTAGAATRPCGPWSARQVLAHCAAALVRIVEDRLEEGVFLPEANARDVAEREHWPVPRILDELECGLTEAGPVIAAHDDGRLDAVALGNHIDARPTAHFHGDAATLIRICSGRPLVRTRYDLTGATEQELLIHR